MLAPVAPAPQTTIRIAERYGPDTIRPTVTAVRVARDGPVLRVTLARPERRNAFDPTLIDGLADAFADVGDARAVVLDGEGPSFSAGADIEWMRASVELTEEENVEDALRFERMLEAVDACEAPVVARVHGHVLGGAAGLIACTDVAVAAEDTVFGFSEVRLGIVPAMISTFVIARIGPGAARRYFLTGERFGAHEALRIGLVHEVRRRPGRGVRPDRREPARRWPGGRARGQAPRPRCAVDGRRGGEANRRAASEPGGSGGPARLPREATSVVELIPRRLPQEH